ncbi:folate-sensitive fragile site protein Fra10Ac1-domain-containing protein [Catenaria anguillulae PL171]|uniref:Folate-sensitive fragile site protein Fra10Ac1-domain-containing protein n=1 Tax=Catenaria anguillulae PL171 TaxID=765915 RepID=A0A1Y2HTA7_9FUNG|nr:folate-sensitive fragile site protein Fra10Ac1-domain-containing protein [Catenaria anguillulae PL171]
MDAHARHQRYIANYVLFYGGRSAIANATAAARARPASYESEADIIRRTHQFLRSDLDGADGSSRDQPLDHLTPAQQWEAQLARAYYLRLFKEYALCDLSRYKSGQIALRWRVEREVLDGKGQLSCANVACDKAKRLKSWEVPFKYREGGQDKRALVKVRVCRRCEKKLHYKKEKDRKTAEQNHSRRSKSSRREEEQVNTGESSSDEDVDAEEAPNQHSDASPSLASSLSSSRTAAQAKSDHARERERSPTASSSSPALSRRDRERDRPPAQSSSSRPRSAPSQADLDEAFAGLFE